MQFIRQNATHKVVIGPVVAVGDGFTPVTTLDVSTADEAEAILHDNGTVVSIAGYTFAAITTADGYYHLTLQSGISGTVGHLTIVINDDSLCLPVKADFTVIEEAVYDAFYAASAPGYVIDQPVNTTKVGGTTQTAGDIPALVTTVDTVVDTINGNVGTAGAGLTNIGTIATVTNLTNLPAAAATAAELAKVPKSDGSVSWNATALADINAQADTALSDYDPPTKAELDSGLAALNDPTAAAIATAVLTTQMTEDYAANGTAPDMRQALFAIHQMLQSFSISGTSVTVRELDNSTTAFVVTLDSASAPTTTSRA